VKRTAHGSTAVGSEWTVTPAAQPCCLRAVCVYGSWDFDDSVPLTNLSIPAVQNFSFITATVSQKNIM